MSTTESRGLSRFVRLSRARFACTKTMVRAIYVSELARYSDGDRLESYIAEGIPFFYRDLPKIQSDLGSGYFVSSIKETLDRLPTRESFRESHFGEIAACLFAEEVLGLRKLYSKFSLLTAENSNAYKMDLLLYDPQSRPPEFVFGEVKSSPKRSLDGLPVGHDRSCFADIFRSLNSYSEDDQNFDLGCAKDRLNELPEPEQTLVRKALMPYADRRIRYAGFIVIDLSTRHDDETSVLATRRNSKVFDIDLVCVEQLPNVAHAAYDKLEQIRQACSL